jgi:hypothetical protein
VSDLIKALQIFLKYGDPSHPTCCEHDTLYVSIDPELVSKEDEAILDGLGFFKGSDGFKSFRFGSC